MVEIIALTRLAWELIFSESHTPADLLIQLPPKYPSMHFPTCRPISLSTRFNATLFAMTVLAILVCLVPFSLVSFGHGLANEIKVRTRHYEPFMRQNATSGQFVDGIEFQLIATIARKLGMQVAFSAIPLDLGVLNRRFARDTRDCPFYRASSSQIF